MCKSADVYGSLAIIKAIESFRRRPTAHHVLINEGGEMTIVIDFSKGFNMGEMNKLIDNLPCSYDDKESMTKQAEDLCQMEKARG